MRTIWLTVALGCVLGACGDDHDDGDHSLPASCEAIASACHDKDTGSGPAHDCHEMAESKDATEQSCAAIKASCLATCSADAG